MCMKQVFDGTLFILIMCNAFIFPFLFFYSVLLDKILITEYQFRNLLEKKPAVENTYIHKLCARRFIITLLVMVTS